MTSKQGGSLMRKVTLMSTCFAAICLSAALLPAASDASTSCSGRTSIGNSGIGGNDVQYHFGCSDTVKGFGIIVNTAVSIFSDSANAFDPKTGAQLDKQSFSCEGNIPGVGVSCSGGSNGFAAAGTRVLGDIGLSRNPCRKRFKLRVWLLVSDAKGAVSGPFQLGGPKDCASGKKSPRR